MNDDTPIMAWSKWHWAALIVGGILWIPIWYGVGSILWFIFSLR